MNVLFILISITAGLLTNQQKNAYFLSQILYLKGSVKVNFIVDVLDQLILCKNSTQLNKITTMQCFSFRINILGQNEMYRGGIL